MKIPALGLAFLMTTSVLVHADTAASRDRVEELRQSFTTPENFPEELQTMFNGAKATFVAGDMVLAKQQCILLMTELARATAESKFPQHLVSLGNLITHHTNTMLGRIALSEDDVAEAKSHLLAAGKAGHSPALMSFGPSMALAKALLEKGEREVVLEYFALCGKFWSPKDGSLAEWTAKVRQGEMPAFPKYLL